MIPAVLVLLVGQIPEAKYADSKARDAVRLCGNAYKKLRYGIVDSTSSRGRSTVWLAPGRVREKQPNVDWFYRKPTLTLYDRKRGRLYRGASPFSEVPDHLAKAFGSMDPITSRLFRHRNPLEVLVRPSTGVKLLGEISLAGVPHQILVLTDVGTRTSVYLRLSDRLMTRIEAEVLDRKGTVLSRGVRGFEYKSLHQALPPDAFLYQGKALPLSKIGR